MALCLHAGAVPVVRADLANVPVPAATASYNPVGHGAFVDVVETQLARIGYAMSEAAYGLTRDGARMFAYARLSGIDALGDGFGLTVGLRSSLDKSMAPAIAFGSHVFVCDNMAFTGEIQISRKQTTYIARDLPALVYDAVQRVRPMAHNQARRFDMYKAAPLSVRDADHAIIEMLRGGIVNTSRVEKVVAEFDEPSYDHGNRSVWRLFNATTEALKDAPIAEIPRRTIALHSLCDDMVGYKMSA